MEVGSIFYTDSDEAMRLVTEAPDEMGRYVWQGVVGGDYRVISVDYLNAQPKKPLDAVVIVDGNGNVWSHVEATTEAQVDIANRWDKQYPKAAPHRVAVFAFKEWV